jgi:hypothetical protein
MHCFETIFSSFLYQKDLLGQRNESCLQHGCRLQVSEQSRDGLQKWNLGFDLAALPFQLAKVIPMRGLSRSDYGWKFVWAYTVSDFPVGTIFQTQVSQAVRYRVVDWEVLEVCVLGQFDYGSTLTDLLCVLPKERCWQAEAVVGLLKQYLSICTKGWQL